MRNKIFYIFIIILIISIASIRIISTYSIFSQTWDEPAHIAAGMEWLQFGEYRFEPLHPPLARVMSALGLYIKGVRLNMDEDNTDSLTNENNTRMWEEGNNILQSGGTYVHNLSLARLGILPFFILASAVVALWSKRIAGNWASIIATLLFTTVPPVLGHAGLATVDMAASAAFTLALFSFYLWIKDSTTKHSIFLGIAIGVVSLSKFTGLYFFIASITLFFLLDFIYRYLGKGSKKTAFYHYKNKLIPALIVIVVTGVTIWAGYRFSFSPIASEPSRSYATIDNLLGSEGFLSDIAYKMIENIPIPAKEMIYGVISTFQNNQAGRTTYLLGEIYYRGRWYYYPLVFAIKTPLTYLILSIIATPFFIFSITRNKTSLKAEAILPLAFMSVFMIAILGRLNLGIRQVLSVYPVLSIITGIGLIEALKLKFKNFWVYACLVFLLFLNTFSSLNAHPDYLAYFNVLAYNQPEKFVVDSDLDWGQDLLRLANELKLRDIDQVYIAYHGSLGIDLDNFSLPTYYILQPYTKVEGWVAISKTIIKRGTNQYPNNQSTWLLDFEPVSQIGKSMLLYHIE